MQTNYEYMKGFNRVKAFLLRVWHSLFFKYAVVAIVGVVIVGFPKAMEKIARERYFMKADDEDIFVLSDDGEMENPIQKHETTE